MNTFDKIKKFCGTFRIILGLIILAAGFYFTAEGELYNLWFGLGALPLIAGITNFCPLCLITKKCTI